MIEAKVVTQGDTLDEAKSLAKDVRILTDGGHVRADGPNTSGHRGWSVSFRIQAPTRQNTTASSSNGSVSLTGLTGALRGDTSNGSVHATDLPATSADDVERLDARRAVGQHVVGRRARGDHLERLIAGGDPARVLGHSPRARAMARSISIVRSPSAAASGAT